MIYIEQTSEAQAIYVPRNTFAPMPGAYVFSIENAINRSRLSVRSDCAVPGSLYYELTVSFPADIQPGEYRYELTNGGCLLASGLLVVGDYATPRNEHNKMTQYRQYE